ncbi:transposable element Tcb2 transposase [Trichonephila clavipes]|nr:transposable element Tcb2 transposase [Trichonephila clavipes]
MACFQVSSMVREKAMERLIRFCIFAREFGTHRIRNPPTTQLQPYWICPGHLTEFAANISLPNPMIILVKEAEPFPGYRTSSGIDPFKQHHTARLQWCHEHHNWTEQDWTCVLFSNESRFSQSSDCRRQLIWRESGTAYRPENIQENDRYPTCSIMVWAGIMINGRTRLHVVANGTMTGQRYIDEVLLPHDCLDSEDIQRLVWPARSPDLNPIGNVWDALGRQVAGRNYLPTNKNTLIRALTEEWDKLPQQLLDNIVQSMVRREECCITLHGGHIPY